MALDRSVRRKARRGSFLRKLQSEVEGKPAIDVFNEAEDRRDRSFELDDPDDFGETEESE